MGAACDTLCSRQSSVNDIQPDTDIMKTRIHKISSSDSNSQYTPSCTPDGVTRTHNQENKTISPYLTTNEGNMKQSLSHEFHEAIKQGSMSLVMFYLEEYQSMNLLTTPFTNNDTVLHVSVKYKQYDLTQKFLQEGASVNDLNTRTGNTALHIAASQNDVQAVKLLLQFGADAYVNNMDDETPLSIAQQYKYKHILNEFGEEMKAESPIADMLTPQTTHHATNSILASSPDFDLPSNEELLQSYNTARLGDITTELFNDITLSIKDNKCKLVKLKAWLQHKQHTPPYSWLKRWVVVSDGYMLWSDRQITAQNGITKEEKMRWNKCVNLRNITNVEIIKSNKQTKFKITAKDLNRDYIWKCKSKQMRDKWINGLTKHIEHYKMEKTFI